MVHLYEWLTLSQVSSGGIKQENKKRKKRKKKEKKLRKVKKGKRAIFGTKTAVGDRGGGEERERERGKGVFHFSLRSTQIESLVFVGARRKVDPRIASYAWVPKSWSFVKLHEVGNFPTWNIFSIKAM